MSNFCSSEKLNLLAYVNNVIMRYLLHRLKIQPFSSHTFLLVLLVIIFLFGVKEVMALSINHIFLSYLLSLYYAKQFNCFGCYGWVEWAFLLRQLMFQSVQIGEANYYHVGYSTKCLSMSCTSSDKKSIVSCIDFGSIFVFKYHHRKVRLSFIFIFFFIVFILWRNQLWILCSKLSNIFVVKCGAHTLLYLIHTWVRSSPFDTFFNSKIR